MVFTLADVLKAKIRIVLWGTLSILIISSGGRVLETINVDQRVGRLVPPADKRLLKQTVNHPSPFPPIPHPQFLLFSPFWSHQWCSHRGAWHQRQRCTHCTEVEPASYFALPIALHWANMHLLLFKLHCSSAVQLQCRLSAQIDSLASPKSYRSCKMNTATPMAGLEAMRDPVQHSRRKPIALQCNLTIIKVIVLQMELSACIAVTPIYSCTYSFLGVFCLCHVSMLHTSCLG